MVHKLNCNGYGALINRDYRDKTWILEIHDDCMNELCFQASCYDLKWLKEIAIQFMVSHNNMEGWVSDAKS